MRSASFIWFLTAAAAAALLDIAQVSQATGGAAVARLAALVVTVYLFLGAVAGALLEPTVRRLIADADRADAALLALALVGFALAVGVPYLNVVHLPGITDPLTIAVNFATLAIATALGVAIARSRTAARVAASVPLALFAGLACIVATAWIATGRDSGSESRPSAVIADGPDVFVIVVDSLRADRLGPDGPAPHLSALAERGRSYSRAYAQASWTKPSVASLFTSLYPSTHGANLRRDRLGTEPVTLPELLAERGYRTAVFSANPWISPAFGFERGVQTFYESETETFARLVMLLRVLKTTDKPVPGRPLTTTLRALEGAFGLRNDRRTNCERDSAIVDEFARWMAGPRERPSFAYFHLMSPHIPYAPPGRDDEYPAAEQVALLHETDPLPDDRRRALLELYDATIEHGDALLGRIVDIIAEAPAGTEHATDAVIVVTADHGEEFFEHGRWGHGKSLYDEVVRVPLVLVAPGVPTGTIGDEPAMLVDVLPTVAGAVGASASAGWEGRDLRESRRADDGRSAYAELVREGGFESYMLYRDGRKYIETTDGVGSGRTTELYDVRRDPAERENLAPRGDAAWAGALESLRARAAARSVAKDQVEIDDAAAERLEALGYVDH